MSKSNEPYIIAKATYDAKQGFDPCFATKLMDDAPEDHRIPLLFGLLACGNDNYLDGFTWLERAKNTLVRLSTGQPCPEIDAELKQIALDINTARRCSSYCSPMPLPDLPDLPALC